jgi:hypothetical protein
LLFNNWLGVFFQLKYKNCELYIKEIFLQVTYYTLLITLLRSIIYGNKKTFH